MRGGGGRRGRSAKPCGGLVAPVMLAAALGAGACGGPADTVSREEFIEAYVALRVAELEGAGNVISDAARDSVLAASGVTEEDLDAFVEVHGGDPVFMSAVWNEVEGRMADLNKEADPVG